MALPGSWTVDELKRFLRDHHLPVSGVKSELVKRVEDCYNTMFFEDELGVVPFQAFHGDMPAPELESLPAGPWKKDSLPLIKEEDALNYLTRKGGYTKNYRTGVRLCHGGHLYDIEVANKGGTF